MSIDKTDKGSNFVEDFVKHCMFNNTDTMEYYEEIQETREYGAVPEIRKIIDNNFNDFCFNNGLWNRINPAELKDDENIMLWDLWNLETLNVKNRYRSKILNYYFSHLKDKISDIKFEDIKDFNVNDYYGRVPAIYKDIEKSKVVMPDLVKLQPQDLELIPYTSEFINIGKSIQFNIEGFPQNQTLYLLIGMCIVDILKKGINNFKEFKELINHIKSYVQLNLKSICFNTCDLEKSNSSPSDKFYNLVTYLTFEEDKLVSKHNFNYRYAPAYKYFENYVYGSKHTKYVKEDNGKSYIITEYATKEEVEKIWEKLEEEFKLFGLSDKLIEMWFDGQLLTRSTCLIGCILIILSHSSKIEFLKDEMPDWKSISNGDFTTTYKVLDKIDVDKIKVNNEFTLIQVLLCIKNYISNIRKLN